MTVTTGQHMKAFEVQSDF